MSKTETNKTKLDSIGFEALDTLSKTAQSLKQDPSGEMAPFAVLVFKDNEEMAIFTIYSDSEAIESTEFLAQLINALREELKTERYSYVGICNDLTGTYEDGERFDAFGFYLERDTHEAWSFVQTYKVHSDGSIETGDFCEHEAADQDRLF